MIPESARQSAIAAELVEHPKEIAEHDRHYYQEDAPVVFTAREGESVRLIGGKLIGGFEKVSDPAVLARLSEGAREHVVRADLRAHGIDDFGTRHPRGMVPVVADQHHITAGLQRQPGAIGLQAELRRGLFVLGDLLLEAAAFAEHGEHDTARELLAACFERHGTENFLCPRINLYAFDATLEDGQLTQILGDNEAVAARFAEQLGQAENGRGIADHHPAAVAGHPRPLGEAEVRQRPLETRPGVLQHRRRRVTLVEVGVALVAGQYHAVLPARRRDALE